MAEQLEDAFYERDFICKTCGAGPLEDCRTRKGRWAAPHAPRIHLANEAWLARFGSGETP